MVGSDHSRRMTFSSLPRGPRRALSNLALPALLVGAALALSGCDAGLEFGDTPLGATADHRAVLLGEPITGSVENPDGAITVTLAPASKRDPREGANSTGPTVVGCTYDDNSFEYSCPTGGLDAGRYRVEVTDAKFRSEGTHLVSVVVSADPDYDPRAHDLVDDAASTGRRAAIELTGWHAGSTVAVYLQGDSGRSIRAATVRIGRDGTARLVVKRLASPAAVLATDGDWDERRVDGWNRVFINAA